MVSPQPKVHDAYAALRVPEFRYWLAAAAFSTLAGRALTVAIGYQVYTLTGSPLALGMLGLVQAIPAVGLSLFGGHLADRYDRRTIVLITRGYRCWRRWALRWSRATCRAAGWRRSMPLSLSPALRAGLPIRRRRHLRPRWCRVKLYVNASSWSGSVWEVTAIAGPTLGGLFYAAFGVTYTYLLVALFYAMGWIFMALIKRKPMPPAAPHESIGESIAVGVRYVYHHQVLLASMALDLFAVLFGGAVALLPIFASDILHVGPAGLGLLVAAPSVGALVSMLWATRRPPVHNAGRMLLWVVAGFGVATIVFALSTVMWLSLVSLAMAGMFDGVSMVIRNTTLRMLSPEHLRGRIAAVNWIFIWLFQRVGGI